MKTKTWITALVTLTNLRGEDRRIEVSVRKDLYQSAYEFSALLSNADERVTMWQPISMHKAGAQ